VTFRVLADIVAFVPLLFIPGETAKFWGPLPGVVIIVRALSLIESCHAARRTETAVLRFRRHGLRRGGC